MFELGKKIMRRIAGPVVTAAAQQGMVNTVDPQLAYLSDRLASLEFKASGLATIYKGDHYSRSAKENERYWTEHNVTNHRTYSSVEDSLEYLEWRNESYPGYIELMPVSGQDGKVVLDYGCGPGHDLVGFSVYSKPEKLIGADISKSSMAQAAERLKLHNAICQFIHLDADNIKIPLEDKSVDYVHCSGVLMLSRTPSHILSEFKRVLKDDGEIRLMVYNYDSIWTHLYVAYMLQLANNIYADRTLLEAFSRTTDGEYCPYVTAWTKADVAGIAREAGLSSEWLGASVSLWELSILPRRYNALMDDRLPKESRKFLAGLKLDTKGIPFVGDDVAGIDACYRLRKAS